MQKKSLVKLMNIYSLIGILCILSAFILLLIPVFPEIWYRLSDQATAQDEDILLADLSELDLEEINQDSSTSISSESADSAGKLSLPPKDSSLPKQNTLIINKIGVNTPIIESQNGKQALYKGVWRVNDFGKPNNDLVTILSAHRYGYLEWSRDFRRKNSFYNLPKLNKGDSIVIIWNQRRYVYKVDKKETKTKITDYKADLILYTCKFYQSPVRVFVYADRIE